jgi:hypothetical protein
VGHWTDISTEVMATSTICYQNSVKICSLAVNMKNTDESLFITVGVLKLLKVPKCEIFDSSNFNDFYTIKSLREGDCGVKIKKIINKYLGLHLGQHTGQELMRMVIMRISSLRACSVYASVPYAYAQRKNSKFEKGLQSMLSIRVRN